MAAPPPELPGVRHEWVAAGELRTHVAFAGPEDAPPLLLVHGWPQNWWAWRGVIPALAERHRVVVPDLRGHGWSADPGTGFEKDRLASDLIALLDALAIERVTWVGHDWGAYVGYLAALSAPARIDRMLALCVPHPWTPVSLPLSLVLLSYQGPISLPWVGPRIADPMVRRILQVGRGGDKLSRADVDRFAETIPPSSTVGMYRTFVTREVIPVARGRLAGQTLSVPTTAMVGARDAVTRGMAPGPVRLQPQLTVEVIEGVAHWVPEQRPQAVVDWVLGGA